MLGQLSATPTIGVRDLKTAREFYERKLGLTLTPESNEFVNFYKTGNGVIEVYQSEFAGTNKATSLTWGAGDEFERDIRELQQKGVEFEHYTMPDTRLEGDVHVMKDMRAAWFKDPDGNILCIHDH